MMRFFGYLLLNVVLLGISPIVTVLFFSALGKGTDTYNYLYDGRQLRYIFGAVGAVLCLVMYLGDLCLPAPDDKGAKGVLPTLFPTILAKVLAVVTSLSLMLAWVFSIGTFPSAPLLVVQLLLHGLVLLMAMSSPQRSGQPSGSDGGSQLFRTVTELMPTTKSESFNIAQVCALIIHGTWTLFLWVFWVGDNEIGGGPNNWNDATRSALEAQGINSARFGASVQNVQLYLWLAPGIASMGLWLEAVVVMCVGSLQRSMRRGASRDGRLKRSGASDLSLEKDQVQIQLTPQEESKIGTLVFTIKLLTAALVILCGCLWITASIVGSSLSLASTVQAFTIVFAAFLVVYIYIALSGENRTLLQRGASASPLMKSASMIVKSDWAKASLFAFICVPLPFYVALSFLNQLVRRLRGTATPSLAKVKPDDLRSSESSEIEASGTVVPVSTQSPGLLTARVEQQMRQLFGWNWTTVHKNLQFLCVLAVSLQVVGGMGTNIFLAWVNAKLSGAGFTTLSAMFFLVGTGMFMIPIVPGIAVYLFGGILIPAGYVRHQGTPNDFTHDTFWIGFAIACLLNFTLKNVAIILQQKGIGEPMSTNLRVLQNVGANTPQMKAVERILKKPGINFPKVTILCGGPDWPTSVLTGILRLSLPQMLLGSIPVVFNVVFVCAAGTFRLRQAENGTWSALSSVALTVASVWTVLQMALAAYFIQETWEKHHTELSKPRKEHVELDWLDKVAAEQQRYKDKVTEWSALPCIIKGLIFSASMMMLLSAFYMIMMQSRCWENFEVTDDIATLGLHFIRNEGWAAIGVFSLSCCLHATVAVYMWLITRKESKAIAEKLQPTKNDWIENRRNLCEEGTAAAEEVSPQEFVRLQSELARTNTELRELRKILEEKGLLNVMPPTSRSGGGPVPSAASSAAPQGSKSPVGIGGSAPPVDQGSASDADTSAQPMA